MIPAKAYKLPLFGHGRIVSRFKPKVSTSTQISCIILLDSALFKYYMKPFPLPEAQEKPLTPVNTNLPSSLEQDCYWMYEFYKKKGNYLKFTTESPSFIFTCKLNPGTISPTSWGERWFFLRAEGRNWYSNEILVLRNCIDAVVFFSATARVSPCSLPVLDIYMQI